MQLQAKEMIKIAIKDLIPYKNNARTHSEEQIEKIMNSINEFGFINPVIIDENDMILVGHGRVMAAEKIGIEIIPCLRIDNLTEDQKKAYILADNKLSDMAGWDLDLLSEELEIIELDMSLFGFEEIEEYEPEFDELEKDEEEDEKFIVKITFDTYQDWLNKEDEFRKLIESSNCYMAVGSV